MGYVHGEPTSECLSNVIDIWTIRRATFPWFYLSMLLFHDNQKSKDAHIL